MPLSYLALGDSYTIGEGVTLLENFPYQTVQLLRKKNIEYAAPEIIAQTGWTTDELDIAMEQVIFLPKYDIVSLLIGVNNQYRGRSIEEFEAQFEHLLQKAIHLADANAQKVFVLSIPDWSVTPFAGERDLERIAEEINRFNNVCKTISTKYSCEFIDITTVQRLDGNKASFLADDGLHPGTEEYAKWAAMLAEKIISKG